MGSAFYHVLVIVVGVVAIIRGFRAGLTRQVSGILGFAFGLVAARTFGPEFAVWLSEWVPRVYHPIAKQFFLLTLSYGLLWSGCMLAFSLLAKILNAIMSLIPVGILNSIVGSAFALLKYLMCLSLLFDLAICQPFGSPLFKNVRHDDGNLVDSVVRLAPALLGSMSVEDYAHRVQLYEAKKIS